MVETIATMQGGATKTTVVSMFTNERAATLMTAVHNKRERPS